MGTSIYGRLVFFIVVGTVIAFPISGLAGVIGAIFALYALAVIFGVISDSSAGSSRSCAAGQRRHGGHCRNRCRRRR